ncbi:hypothetical protein ACHWGL_31195, partial [Klebsiella pneumoniae]|uniref:hypothetical protein n=1 Tax=Klebsiella pneumoniae TaxID=573 RepID=UPI00376F1AE7
NQVFVRVHRGVLAYGGIADAGFYDVPSATYGGGTPGVPAFGGYDTPIGGYDLGSIAYLVPNPPYGSFAGTGFYASEAGTGSLTDTEIYARID